MTRHKKELMECARMLKLGNLTEHLEELLHQFETNLYSTLFVPAIPIFWHSAILIFRYISASQLQNYYILMIYQSIFAKISI